MKILHLIYDDLNNPWLGGGGVRRVFEIYKHFPPSYDILILTGKYKNATIRRYKNITFKPIGIGRSYLISRLTYSLLAPIYLLIFDYDIVVDDYTAFSPTFSFIFSKKPVIGSFQNLHSLVSYKKLGILGILVKFLDFMAIKLFRYITPVSPFLEQYIKKKKKTGIVKFIGVGVNNKLFEIKKSYNKKLKYILYLGRIDIFHKGLDILLDAFEIIKNKFPDIYLVIAGGGKDIEKLKKLVKEKGLNKKVKIPGRVSEKKKSELFKNALFVCLPSRFEAFPVLPIESLATGTPVIASNIPGIDIIIKHNKTGLLFETENYKMLAQLMEKLLKNPSLRKRLATKGRKSVLKYRWEKISKEFENFIKEVYFLNEKSD